MIKSNWASIHSGGNLIEESYNNSNGAAISGDGTYRSE